MPTPKDYSPFVPFDLYDFFGYIFPSVIFSASILLFYNSLRPGFYSSWISQPTNQEIPFVTGLAIVVAAIVLLYALGHVIATVSHIIIDRVLIDGIEGYPVNFLLDIRKPTREYSESTFKYLFACFNLLLLAPALPLAYSTMVSSVLILFAFILILISQRIIVMLVRRRPGGHEISHKLGDKRLFRLFLKPAKIIDVAIDFFRRLLGMDRPFSPGFLRTYRKVFSRRFGGLISVEEGSNNYWLSAFAAGSNDEVHDRTLHTWLHLYGFARNAAAAIYLSSALIICHLLFNPDAFTGSVPLQLGIQWTLASVFGIRYWVLYSHYYTKGVMRAFLEIETRKK